MMIFEMLLAIESEEEKSVVEQIYSAHFKKMCQVCYNILMHAQDAEDAAMSAMVRIAENASKFLDKDRNEIAVLVVIYTRNAALSYYNQRKRRNTISTTVYDENVADDVQMEFPDESQDVQKIVINNETLHMIKAALEQLSDEQKDVILLRYYYGYRYTEMTKILGVPENVIRARAFRAKKKLRELLGEEAYERMSF